MTDKKKYSGDRWKWHKNEYVLVDKDHNKSEKQKKKDEEFMKQIDNLPDSFFNEK